MVGFVFLLFIAVHFRLELGLVGLYCLVFALWLLCFCRLVCGFCFDVWGWFVCVCWFLGL